MDCQSKHLPVDDARRVIRQDCLAVVRAGGQLLRLSKELLAIDRDANESGSATLSFSKCGCQESSSATSPSSESESPSDPSDALVVQTSAERMLSRIERAQPQAGKASIAARRLAERLLPGPVDTKSDESKEFHDVEFDRLMIRLRECNVVSFSDWDDDTTRRFIRQASCATLRASRCGRSVNCCATCSAATPATTTRRRS
jgi:hypothetical protein